MALNYSVSLRPHPQDKNAAPKAYATAQINGELSLKQLSKRVASQTTVSRADVVAVLTATVDNLLEALAEGKQVDFGELGKFRLQVTSEGVDKAAEFTAANITGVNIRYIPGEDLKAIFSTLEFQPVASRAAQAAALRAEKEGKLVTDLLKDKEEAGEGTGEGTGEEAAA